MSANIDSILKTKLSLTFGVKRHIWVAAVLYVLLISIFESLYFGIGFSQFFAALSNFDPLYFAIALFYLALSLYLSFILVLATLLSKWPYQVLFIGVFVIATLFEYGYARALGRFTNLYDIAAAIFLSSEQRADSVFEYFNPIAIIPIIILIALCVLFKKSKRAFYGWRMPCLLVLVIVFYIHFSYVNVAFFDRQFVSNSFGSFCQTTADFAISNPFIKPKTRNLVEIPASTTNFHPTNNIIFVLDESVRADHLSLNGYSRPTTPFLESLLAKGQLVNYGIAVSAATSSLPSYDGLVPGATPDMIASLSMADLNSLPSLFQYAKAMNYQTHLIDGQMKGYWAGNPDDLNYIDDYTTIKELDSPDRIEDYQSLSNKITDEALRTNGLKQWEIDRKIAGLVNQIFSSSTGNFVFIIKRGDHFPYEKNYPDSEAFWKPVYHFKEQYEIPPEDKFQSIVNSYDDAIRYNIDSFFRVLAADYSSLPNNTVIIYTSDHGESFFANGKAGHGGETKGEAAVPLFILGMKDRTVDTGFKASHANIFTTLLDLMNYPEELRKYPYAISLFRAKTADSRPRFFNPSLNKKIPFD